MGRRTNRTNRAGAKLGLNKHKLGVPVKPKDFDLRSLNDKVSKKYNTGEKSNALV
ncbi:MAG: hypothetical protein ACRDBO_00045 [Lachnospiraceae bacterium]